MGTLNVVVLYDRWEEEEDEASAAGEKSPLTRTLDKKEVEDEVADALGKLGHTATLHCLDGSIKSLHAIARMDCDLVFNLAESFDGKSALDSSVTALLNLLGLRYTGSSPGGLLPRGGDLDGHREEHANREDTPMVYFGTEENYHPFL